MNRHRLSHQAVWGTGAMLIGALAVGPALADDINWVGPDSGSTDWDNESHWNPAVPGSSDRAFIEDEITGDRTILTPTGSYTINGLNWTHQDVDFVNTLRLGGDLDVNGPTFGERVIFDNQTGDASKMVVDLNGYTFDMRGWAADGVTSGRSNPFYDAPVTYTTSGGPGRIELRDVRGIHADTYFDAGVTLWTGGGNDVNKNFIDGGIWHADSTYHFANTGTTRIPGFPEGGLGHMILGDASNGSGSVWEVRGQSGGANDPHLIKGDFTIHPSTDANSPSGMIFTNFNGGNDPHIWIGGDFNDFVTGDQDHSYGGGPDQGGHITFQGNPDSARSVDVRRTGMTGMHFYVGVDASNVGNIVLEHDLITEGTVTVRDGSILDVADKTITAGYFTADDGAELSYTIGADSGLIELAPTDYGFHFQSGGITLDGFTLNITNDGTWIDGDDLVLMTYEGTFSGTPVLTLGAVPEEGFSYDELLTDNGQIRLTNVVIPEPASVALLAAGGLMMLVRRRGGGIAIS